MHVSPKNDMDLFSCNCIRLGDIAKYFAFFETIPAAISSQIASQLTKFGLKHRQVCNWMTPRDVLVKSFA